MMARPRWRVGATAVLIALLGTVAYADSPSMPHAAAATSAPAAGADAARSPFRAARVPWQTLRYGASKLFVRATVEVELRWRPAAGIDLLPVANGAPRQPPGPRVGELTYRSSMLGRREHETLAFVPGSGVTLQRSKIAVGRYAKVERYADAQVRVLRYKPASGLPADDASDWPLEKERFRALPTAARSALAPGVLLYAVAAAPLDRIGDRAALAVYDDTLGMLDLEVLPQADGLEVETVHIAGQPPRPPGEVLRIAVRPRGTPFEFLGLRGDLTLWLEADTRLPLQIDGDAQLIGALAVKLEDAQLAPGASA
ncbi:MAG: hypothetical protein AAF772_11835 [Acidobacteriota bacterium]